MEKKRVGFKHYDVVAETSEVPATTENKKDRIIAISPQQAELLENIKNLSEIIVEKSFSKYTEAQRISFVSELLKNVSLNTEINTMRNLLQ